MSSYFSRTRYDPCFNVQSTGQTTKIFTDYTFEKFYFENTLKSNTVATCDGKFAHIECKSCDSNKGSLDPTLEATLPQRLDDEGSLLGIDLLLSKCDSNKFQPCYKDNKKSCEYNPISQPLLCDRLIVKTNMTPYADGFHFKLSN